MPLSGFLGPSLWGLQALCDFREREFVVPYLFPDSREFVSHGVVRHMHGEYVNKENPEPHTNTIEGFFSVFKRGMKGVYQHCQHNHLHRYVAELDFRYNNRKALDVQDVERADKLLREVYGKRLKYETAYCLSMPTGTRKRKKRSSKVKRTAPEQSARFVKESKGLGLDQASGEAFERALDAVTKAKANPDQLDLFLLKRAKR